MRRSQPPRHRRAGVKAQARRATALEGRRTRRRNDVRAAWAAATLAVLLASGSLVYFLTSDGPPFEGRGAALANWLHAHFGPIGPALPWLAISGVLAFIAFAASRGWGKDVT